MSNTAINGMERRTFLKAAAGAAAVAAGSALVSSAALADEPQDGEPHDEEGGEESSSLPAATGLVGGAICPEDWLGEMPVVPEDQISAVYDYDVVVLGCGHAGAQGALAAAQEGVKVAMVEAQEEDSYSCFGDDIAAYNSQFTISHGYGPYKLGDIVAEYVRRGNGRVNTEIIRKYIENSGEMFDNLMSITPDTSNAFDYEGGQCIIQHAYEKESAEYYPIEIAGYKCWATTFQTVSTTNPTPVYGREGISRLTELELYTLHAAMDLGADMYWGHSAYSLVMDGDAVTGAIVEAPDGSYIQLNASKGVLLTTGDFSGNADMVYNLLDEVAEWGARTGEDRSRMAGFGRNGQGIKLGCWAGGAIEPHPRPTMDGKIPGAWHTTPMLFINSEGNRFMNECMAQLIEPNFRRQPWGEIGIFTDAKFMQSIEQVGVDHGAPNWGKPDYIFEMEAAMEAIEPGPEGGYIPGTDVISVVNHPTEYNEQNGNYVYKANTLDELLDYMGYEGEVKENVLASIDRYNEMCAAGEDTDYGKDANFLISIDTPPFYACFDDNKKDTRAGLVCLAGLSCDENFNVLTVDRQERIKGLYAAGNCLGERYGNGYVGTSAGNSIGMAMTHGRVAGKTIAAL